MKEEIKKALREDQTIDIITIGAKTGLPRRIEIWFTNIDGRIIICGTPGATGGPATGLAGKPESEPGIHLLFERVNQGRITRQGSRNCR
jgi:hypothetical protein